MSRKCKSILLGEIGVGKTCIITRFITGEFNPNTISSVHTQYKYTKQMIFNDKAIKFDIWDTAGQERFRYIARIFIKMLKLFVYVMI